MKKLTSVNPGRNFEVNGEIPFSTEKQIAAAVKSARGALASWSLQGVGSRVQALEKVYERFQSETEELAQSISIEMGMPITQSRFEMEDGLRFFRWYLDNAEQSLAPEQTHTDESSIHMATYEPIGVAAVIVPWNYPFSNVMWGAVPNLLAGNTVVFKHAEQCPLTATRIEKMFQESALPEGVITFVYGDGSTGAYLASQEIDLIVFTGSTNVGFGLYKSAAERFIRIVLELGGSAPGIVFADADLDSVAESVYGNRYSNAGQMCDALKRLIVHESRLEEMVSKLKALVEAKTVGDPLDEATDIGPLVSAKQLETLERQVADAVKKGATIVTGGARPENVQGAYYKSTILTGVTPDMRVWKEEVFGPVLPVLSFQTQEEAIKLANDTQYGLGAYVYTKDLVRAQEVARLLHSGMVSINGVSYVHPFNPFGGYKQSGLGREHGHFGFRDVSQVKVISHPK